MLGEREDRTLPGDSLGGRTPGDGVAGSPDGVDTGPDGFGGTGLGDTGLGGTGVGDEVIDETAVDGLGPRPTGDLRDGPGVINVGGRR